MKIGAYGWTAGVCVGVSLIGAVVLANEMAGRTAPGAPVTVNAARRAAVLVELFTSEGCSSCPSADDALAQLQSTQPIRGAEIIPLSEHVDYWNYIGWADPFSSSAFSERQRSYAAALRLESVYTPQMVVNGRTEFVGSDRDRARGAIEQAAATPHAEVTIDVAPAGGAAPKIAVRVENMPAVQRGDSADVMLAVTEDSLRSSVSRGENAGRRLSHTAVVRQMRQVGAVTPGVVFAATPTLSLDPRWKRSDLSAVVFVQERNSRRVLGAARARLSAPPRD